MRNACTQCGTKIENASIEVSVNIRGAVYTTFIVGQTCGNCRKTKVDPNELATYSIGVAKSHIARGYLTGRSHAFCRKALRLAQRDYAKGLGISEECLVSLEESEALVAKPIFDAMARHVRRYFKALAFVPRIPLDDDSLSSSAP